MAFVKLGCGAVARARKLYGADRRSDRQRVNRAHFLDIWVRVWECALRDGWFAPRRGHAAAVQRVVNARSQPLNIAKAANLSLIGNGFSADLDFRVVAADDFRAHDPSFGEMPGGRVAWVILLERIATIHCLSKKRLNTSAAEGISASCATASVEPSCRSACSKPILPSECALSATSILRKGGTWPSSSREIRLAPSIRLPAPRSGPTPRYRHQKGSRSGQVCAPCCARL